MSEPPDQLNRRIFLQRLFALGGAALVIPLGACEGRTVSAYTQRRRSVRLRPPESAAPARVLRRVAGISEVEVGPGRLYRTWCYDGKFPGQEIRCVDGEHMRIVLRNELPEETTIHWHGLPVPNVMDGVPGVTQDPARPETEFAYDFTAGPAGSYIYHTHVGLQLDRGLLGPLIVEEKQPQVPYDREYTIILDDFLAGDPAPLPGGGMMGGGMMGGIATPAYDGLLLNGRLASWPPEFEVRSGERVRLRLINPSGATTYRVAVAGHRMLVTHADGRPVRPVTVDSITISMGERYDAILDANNPGLWTLMAAPIEVNAQPARATIRYLGVNARPPQSEVPEGLRGGRSLTMDDLVGLEGQEDLGRSDRVVDLALSGGMMSSAWTINGQAYPSADPIEIREGELVEFRMVNHSMMIHPMHLHGHFFQVGRAWKDTVAVPPHMGRVNFRFIADNPGKWFFHCHNLYHMEAGMARVVRYI